MAVPQDGAPLKARRYAPTPVLVWLRLWATVLACTLAFYFLLDLVPFFHSRGPREILWAKTAAQALSMSFTYLVLMVGPELRARKNRPRRSPAAASVEILNLSGTVLHSLPAQDLQRVRLPGADLQSAVLWGEQLPAADLSGANLSGAWLRAAVLEGADLSGAILRETNLIDADLRSADLRGADLTRAKLAGAVLHQAVYDDATRWPPGFRPDRQGCIRADGIRHDLPLPAQRAEVGAESLPRPAGIPEGRRCSGGAEGCPKSGHGSYTAPWQRDWC